METRIHFSRVKEWIGAFVLIALALGILGLLLAGRAQRWFATHETIKVVLPEEGAFGLREGSEVHVLGISAGWVDEINVEKDRITARVRIRSDFRRFVRTDSVATIQKTLAVAGDAFLEITRGEGPPLPEDDPTIPAVAPEDLLARLETRVLEVSEQITPTMMNARAMLAEWKELGADLNRTQAQLRDVLMRAQQIAANLQEGQGTVGQLLVDPALAEQSRSLLNQAQHALTNLHAALDNLQEGAALLPDLGDRLTAGAENLPGLMLQVQQTLREIETFFDGLQRHWLVRGYMDTGEPPPRIPPFRVEGGGP
jgi:phospholipid/cholesterol/gamma-HCH transport system substrate-binding protein